MTYLEEPVSSDDLEGLRLVRDRAPAGIAIAAGEYGWNVPYFQRMLAAGAVDILQADVTRCGGITGLLRIDALCTAHHVPFSAHCAPAVSAHACAAMETLQHLEYFHDHVRIERLLFDGTLDPEGGFLEPDRSRPGLGLELRRSDAAEFEVVKRLLLDRESLAAVAEELGLSQYTLRKTHDRVLKDVRRALGED